MILKIKLFTKIRLYFLVIITMLIFTCIYIAWDLPQNLVLLENEEYLYNVKSILPLKVSFDKQETVTLQVEEEKSKPVNQFQFSNSIFMKTLSKGNANLQIKLFGIFPIKTIEVDVIPKWLHAAIQSE